MATDNNGTQSEGTASENRYTGSGIESKRGYYVHGSRFPPSPDQLFEMTRGCVDARIDTIFMSFCEIFPWTVDPILQLPHALPEQAIDEFQRDCTKKGITLVPILPGPAMFSFLTDCSQFAHFRSDVGPIGESGVPVFDVDTVGAGKMLEDLIDDLLSLLPNTDALLVDLDSCKPDSEGGSDGAERVRRLQERFVRRISAYLSSIDIGVIIKAESGRFSGFPRMVEHTIGEDTSRVPDSRGERGIFFGDREAEWVLCTVREESGGSCLRNRPSRDELFAEAARFFDGRGAAIRYPTAARCEWSVASDGCDEFLSMLPRVAEDYRHLTALLGSCWYEVRTVRESLIFAYGGGTVRVKESLRRRLDRVASSLEGCREFSGKIVRESERFVSSLWLHRWRASILEPLREEYNIALCRLRQLFPDSMSD